jgi:hypothetical protein
MTEIGAMARCGTATIRRLLELDGVPQRPSYRRPPPDSGVTREWLEREYVVKLRSIETLSRERGVTAPYLMSLARNWGLPVRHHSQFSGIGHLDLPVPPSPAMRAVTMRKGALRRLELITQIPGYASIAAASRVLYDGRASALVQMLHKIESAAGFIIIDRSGPLLAPTAAGREFIEEALSILQCAQEQMAEPAPDVAGGEVVPERVVDQVRDEVFGQHRVAGDGGGLQRGVHPPVAQAGGVEDVFGGRGQVDLFADGEPALVAREDEQQQGIPDRGRRTRAPGGSEPTSPTPGRALVMGDCLAG